MNKLILSLRALIFIFLLYIPAESFAWGQLGHRIVGQVAEQHLNPRARREIKKILGTETVALASTWADFIKSDRAYNYLNSWHYIDFHENASAEDLQNYLKQDTATDAYTKLKFLTSELKKKSLPQNLKVQYLRLVIHIVGDLHQPMHVGREEDKGGNDVKLTWFNKPTNLHSVWDSELIESQQLSYTEYAAAVDHPTKEQIRSWQKDDINTWIRESHDISTRVYKEAETNQKLSYRYIFDHVGTVNEQLEKGGVRLAGLLNEIFG